MAVASGVRAGKAFVELFADTSRLATELKNAETKLKAFGDKASSIGGQFTALGLAMATPIAFSTATFASFDDQMRATQGVTKATGVEFERLTEKAKELGRTTSFTAAEVASGMLGLGRAGFGSKEIDDSIAGVMDLSRATQTEIPLATDIAGNALRAFGLETTEMGRVCDVLTATANGSAQTLEDLGEAMTDVAPIASKTDMSLEDVAKVLGSLANFGIKGSRAGTAVKNILTRMADPAIQRKYDELGISVADASGNLRNMADVLRDVGAATAEMPNAERLAVFKDLFGMYGIAGGANLSNADFASLYDAIDGAQGEAARVAKDMDKGLGGSFRLTQSAVEGVEIAVGEALTPALTDVCDKIQTVCATATTWIAQNEAVVATVSKFVAGLTAGGVSLVAFGMSVKAIASSLSLVRSSATGVAAAVSALGVAGTASVAAFAAGGYALVRWANASSRAADAARSATDAVRRQNDEHAATRAEHQALFDRLVELQNKTDLTNQEFAEGCKIVQQLRNYYGDLGIQIDEVGKSFSGATEAKREFERRNKAAEIADVRAEKLAVEAQLNAVNRENEDLYGTKNDEKWYDAKGVVQWAEGKMSEDYAAKLWDEQRALRARLSALEEKEKLLKDELESKSETDESGETGETGTPGEPGAPGEPGEDGENGKDGESQAPKKERVSEESLKEARAASATFERGVDPYVGLSEPQKRRFEIQKEYDEYKTNQETILAAARESNPLDLGAAATFARNMAAADVWKSTELAKADAEETERADRERRETDRNERDEAERERQKPVEEARAKETAARLAFTQAQASGSGVARARKELDAATKNRESVEAEASQKRAEAAIQAFNDAQKALEEARKTGIDADIELAQERYTYAAQEVQNADADLEATLKQSENGDEQLKELEQLTTSVSSSGTFNAFEALALTDDWEKAEQQKQTALLDKVQRGVDKIVSQNETGEYI